MVFRINYSIPSIDARSSDTGTAKSNKRGTKDPRESSDEKPVPVQKKTGHHEQ